MQAERARKLTRSLREAWRRQDERADRNCAAFGAWLDRELERSRPHVWLSACGLLSSCIACTANLVALITAASFFLVARGEWIRPMGWPGVEFMVAAFGFLAVPLGLLGVFGRRKLPAFIGIALGLTPFF